MSLNISSIALYADILSNRCFLSVVKYWTICVLETERCANNLTIHCFFLLKLLIFSCWRSLLLSCHNLLLPLESRSKVSRPSLAYRTVSPPDLNDLMEDEFLASQIPSEFPELAEHLVSAGLQGSLTQFGKFPTHS